MRIIRNVLMFTLICPTTKWVCELCKKVCRWPITAKSLMALNKIGLWQKKKQETLSIVATKKEFQSMLISVSIHVFTDHNNLTFDELGTQWILHWWKIEEFLPWLHYIEGSWNILADNCSKLDCLPTPSQIAEEEKLVEPTLYLATKMKRKASSIDFSYSSMLNEDINAVLECYHNLPETSDPAENPFSYACIYKQQQQVNNFWLYKQIIQSSMFTNNKMMISRV